MGSVNPSVPSRPTGVPLKGDVDTQKLNSLVWISSAAFGAKKERAQGSGPMSEDSL